MIRPVSLKFELGWTCESPKLRRITAKVLNAALKYGLGYEGSFTNFVEDVTVGADIVFDLRALV